MRPNRMYGKNFFNLHKQDQRILRELAPGVSTRIFPGDHAMLSVVCLDPGCESEIHSHRQEQWGILLEGSGIRIQNGEETPVSSGDFWRTSPDISHAFRAGPKGARVLDVFSPPRDEYRVKGSGVKTT